MPAGYVDWLRDVNGKSRECRGKAERGVAAPLGPLPCRSRSRWGLGTVLYDLQPIKRKGRFADKGVAGSRVAAAGIAALPADMAEWATAIGERVHEPHLQGMADSGRRRSRF